MQLFMLQRQRPCRSQRKKKQPLGLNGPQNAFDEENVWWGLFVETYDHLSFLCFN